jgi:hypothetical protein
MNPKATSLVKWCALSALSSAGAVAAWGYYVQAQVPLHVVTATSDTHFKHLESAVRRLQARVGALEAERAIQTNAIRELNRSAPPAHQTPEPSLAEESEAFDPGAHDHAFGPIDTTSAPLHDKLEQALANQRPDSDWSDAVLLSARRVWTEVAPEAEVRAEQCGSTLCRVELVFDEDQAAAVRGVSGVAPSSSYSSCPTKTHPTESSRPCFTSVVPFQSEAGGLSLNRALAWLPKCDTVHTFRSPMQPQNTVNPLIDYDSPPVAMLDFEQMQYRVDTGMRAAVAVSSRPIGEWTWQLVTEGRWDGVRLKAKGVERLVVEALERALRAASDQGD